MAMDLEQFLEKFALNSLSLVLFLSFLIFIYKWLFRTNATTKNKPPSPPKLPVFGNLHQLGRLPHHSLRALSQQYGDLMLLHIGSKPTIVASSSDMAREIMKTRDVIFANRPNLKVARRVLYDGKDLAFASYGEYWRQMKSICVLHVLSSKKVRSFRQVREEEAAVMVDKIRRFRQSSEEVNLSEIIASLTKDVICRAAFGRKYTGEEGCANIRELLNDFSEALGAFCMQDFVPWLGWIDRLTGVDRKANKVANALDGFIEKIVQEHVERLNLQTDSTDEADKEEKLQDFVDILLEIQRENSSVLPRESIKAILMVKFLLLCLFCLVMNSIFSGLEKETCNKAMALVQLLEKLPSNSLSLFLIFSFLFFLYKWLYATPATNKNQPPSPRKLPVFGNLHQLGKLPHRSLRALSQQYGDLMLLHVGSKPTIVASSADTAREIMKTHDVVFANRPNLKVARRFLYDGKDLVFASYGEYWRQMKSICVLHVLSSKKVRSFREVREEEAAVMVDKIRRFRQSSEEVNLSEIIASLTKDVICRVAFGRKYTGEEGCANIRELLSDFSEVVVAFCMQDSVPWLGWIDRLSGVDRKANRVANVLDEFIEKIVQEHVDRLNLQTDNTDEADKGEKLQDFVDTLLELQRENSSVLPRESIKAILMVKFTSSFLPLLIEL
ncbi:hypothetical protein SOVF_084470 [Spinacia oleracea]|nr:hypothetical protein SOVF_084470 [Spinacia oleracea]